MSFTYVDKKTVLLTCNIWYIDMHIHMDVMWVLFVCPYDFVLNSFVSIPILRIFLSGSMLSIYRYSSGFLSWHGAHNHRRRCRYRCLYQKAPMYTLMARFMGSTWDPPGADRTQVGPMLAPWSLLSGQVIITVRVGCPDNSFDTLTP